uniref:Si:ch211-1a19.3 n=1 Tax=Sinocyclocheilus grahami TaxID=75366 RepID=A0A672QVE5_SINGR
MTSSKSSQTTRNIVIACLALWSIISLIIIVVWATSPEMKGASQCRTEMQDLRERHEGAKVVWTKDRKALEDLVRQGWRNQTTLQKQIDLYKEQIQSLNISLNDSLQEIAILNENITVLDSKNEKYKLIEENRTAEISLQKDQIEALEHNLTLKAQELASCEALHLASKQLQTAAEKQKQACETTKQYLQKQQGNYHVQGHYHITGSTVKLQSYKNTFLRKENKNNDFIPHFRGIQLRRDK